MSGMKKSACFAAQVPTVLAPEARSKYTNTDLVQTNASGVAPQALVPVPEVRIKSMKSRVEFQPINTSVLTGVFKKHDRVLEHVQRELKLPCHRWGL